MRTVMMMTIMMICVDYAGEKDDDFVQNHLHQPLMIAFLEPLSSLFNVSKNSNLDMHKIL